MKIVEGFSQDVEVRRAGLGLVVRIVEHGGGRSHKAEENEGMASSAGSPMPFTRDAAALANRFGAVGAVEFIAAWLRDITAPMWAWRGAGYGDTGCNSEERMQDLFSACKAAALLCRHSSRNRDRLATMGACDSLTRAVALSGQTDGPEDAAGKPMTVGAISLSSASGSRSIRMETQVWAAQAVAELAAGHSNENRCGALIRAGALKALFAAMSRRPADRQLQRAGCLALGSVARASSQAKDLHNLGRNGGAHAVIFALEACADDVDVAWAGLLAVGKLSISAENRRLLGEAGACPLVSSILVAFVKDARLAEEGCRAVAGLAALSGFNRTALGRGGAAEATALVLRSHPSKMCAQRWGLAAAAALVADTDPSGNTSKLTHAGVLTLACHALARFPHNPLVQTEGLRVLAKVATTGGEGLHAVWEEGAHLTTTRALGLYLNDGSIQHWGMATMRELTDTEKRCEAWRGAGAPEAVVRTLRSFGEGGLGCQYKHDEGGEGRCSEARACTSEEALCIQFQACACAINLADAPHGRRRLVREGAGEALAGMMTRNPLNGAAQRGALTALAALSASGVENRRRLHRYKGGVPVALVKALETFPDDRRVRCEGALTIQNLSFTVGGARAMTRAGVPAVVLRLLLLLVETAPAVKSSHRTGHVSAGEGVGAGEHLDRDGESG